MILRNKKIVFLLFLLTSLLAGYLLWLVFRPVNIVAVHQRNNHSDVLVKNFPFTSRGKINWWLSNEESLKEKFGIPKPASYGSFTITFWLFGEGYKERGKYDRLCFDDMQGKENCIEKNSIFIVSRGQNKRTFFTVDNGRYILDDNSELVKIKDW